MGWGWKWFGDVTILVNFYPTLAMMRIPLLGLVLVLTVLNNNTTIVDHYSGGEVGIGLCSEQGDQ